MTLETIRVIHKGDSLYREFYDINLEIIELEKYCDKCNPKLKKALDYRDNLQIVINEVRAAHEKDLWYLHMGM